MFIYLLGKLFCEGAAAAEQRWLGSLLCFHPVSSAGIKKNVRRCVLQCSFHHVFMRVLCRYHGICATLLLTPRLLHVGELAAGLFVLVGAERVNGPVDGDGKGTEMKAHVRPHVPSITCQTAPPRATNKRGVHGTLG